MPTIPGKDCVRCHKQQPLYKFAVHKGMKKDGRHSVCKQCFSDSARTKREAAREKKYGPPTPAGTSRCIKCKAVKDNTDFPTRSGGHKRHFRRECKDCAKDYHRRFRLKNDFDLTQEDYNRMHEEQLGVCAICDKEETIEINGVARPLVVDHCHKTGKVRGLLCHRCNTGLGHFDDNPESVKRAFFYLLAKQQV